MDAKMHSSYKRAILSAVVQQITAFVVIIGLDCVDSGFAYDIVKRSCGIASLAYWIVSGLILLGRPAMPSRLDLMLVRFGFVPLFGITFLIARGFSPNLF